MDPPRLRSDPGTFEGRLLRSAPSFEPAPSAEGELWRRLQIATAVGLAAGAGTAVHTAAAAAPDVAAKVAGKAIWLAIVKWGAVVAIGVPVATLTTRAVIRDHAASARAIASQTAPAPAPVAPPAAPEASPPLDTAPPEPAASPAPPSVAPAPHASHVLHHSSAPPSDARSALRAESALLGAARAKLAADRSRGALDDVAQLNAQFPRGRLVQEREVVAIDALTALGDRAPAHARAAAFLERFPKSPYATHVQEMLAR